MFYEMVLHIFEGNLQIRIFVKIEKISATSERYLIIT